MSRLLLVLFVLLGAHAATGCASATDHRAVIDREIEWAEAMAAHDIETLESIMAVDYRLMFDEVPPFGMPAADGTTYPGLPRHMWLGNLVDMTFGPIEMAKVDVKPIADDLVAVNMWMTLSEWKAGGPPPPGEEASEGDLSGTYSLTDIWLYRDGRWQVVSRLSRPLEGVTPPEPDFVVND